MARLESGGFGSSSGSSTSSMQLEEGVGLVQRGGTTTTQEQEQEEDLEEMDTGGLTEDTGGGTPEPTDGADETTTDTDASQDVEPATARASESVSLGTTGVGTTGTLQSRLRARTPEAGVGPGFGTDTYGTRIGGQAPGGDTVQRASQIGGEATTYADRELQEGEQIERVRSDVEEQLQEEGIDTEDVNIDVQRGADGFTADVTANQQEEFGDAPIYIGDRRLEDYLGSASETIQEGGVELGERAAVASPLPYLVGSAVGGETGAKRAVDFQTSAVEGAAALADIPGLALTAKEAAEFGVYGAEEVASGEGEEFLEQTSEAGVAAGAAFADFATENPFKTSGLLAGSLVGSAGAMSTAARINPRLGTATRYAIQPGEELAGTLGYRATRAASSTRTADRLFPNREPLIFSEEAAIRGGRVASRFTRSKASSGLDVGKSAVARARSRLPDRSDVTPDTSGDSFFIDARTGELVEEGSIRPALYDPEAETNVPDADRPDMIQSLDTEAETERTPGSGAGGGGELSGVVEIDLRKDTGMVETSLLEFEGNARTEAIAETETETRMTPETETRTEVETEQEVRRVQPEAVREAQAAADAMAVELEPMETQFQPERLAQETGIDLELGQETEVAVEQELGFETEQEVEQALEQEFEQETEQETETETEVETRRELEGETLPDDDERRFTEYPKVTEDEFRFASEAATPEEVLEFSFDDLGE